MRGFKRDYDENREAVHSSWTAGTIYARGLEEAPGHVAARRQKYLAVSREWHAFLGFEGHEGKRRRVLEDINNRATGDDKQQKVAGADP